MSVGAIGALGWPGGGVGATLCVDLRAGPWAPSLQRPLCLAYIAPPRRGGEGWPLSLAIVFLPRPLRGG